MTAAPRDRTAQLRHLMQQVHLSSFKALSQASGISEKQLRHLRSGDWATLRLDTVLKLSRVFGMTVEEVMAALGAGAGRERQGQAGTGRERKGGAGRDVPLARLAEATNAGQAHVAATSDRQELATLRQEYDRLQHQLSQQREVLWQEFQQASVQVIESLLLQLPTALYAAQQNPQAPAVKLIPLLRPIDALLEQWGMIAIAPVGSEIPYDPQSHQLLEGTANPGDRVRVRYTGYRQGEKLLYRAKVSPVGHS